MECLHLPKHSEFPLRLILQGLHDLCGQFHMLRGRLLVGMPFHHKLFLHRGTQLSIAVPQRPTFGLGDLPRQGEGPAVGRLGLHQLEPLLQGGILSRCSVCEPRGLAQERDLTFGIFSLSDLREELSFFVVLEPAPLISAILRSSDVVLGCSQLLIQSPDVLLQLRSLLYLLGNFRLTLFDLLQQAPNLWRVLLPRRSDLRHQSLHFILLFSFLLLDAGLPGSQKAANDIHNLLRAMKSWQARLNRLGEVAFRSAGLNLA